MGNERTYNELCRVTEPFRKPGLMPEVFLLSDDGEPWRWRTTEDELSPSDIGIVAWMRRRGGDRLAHAAALGELGCAGKKAVAFITAEAAAIREENLQDAAEAGFAFLGRAGGLSGDDPVSASLGADARYMLGLSPYVIAKTPAPSTSAMTGDEARAAWAMVLMLALNELPYPLLSARGLPRRKKLPKAAESLAFLSGGALAMPDAASLPFASAPAEGRGRYLHVPDMDDDAFALYDLVRKVARLSEGADGVLLLAGVSIQPPLADDSPVSAVLEASGFRTAAEAILGEDPDWQAYDKWQDGIDRLGLDALVSSSVPGAELFPGGDIPMLTWSAHGGDEQIDELSRIGDTLLGGIDEASTRWLVYDVRHGYDMRSSIVSGLHDLQAARPEGDWMLVPAARRTWGGNEDEIAAACALCGLVPDGVTKIAVIVGKWTTGKEYDPGRLVPYQDGLHGIHIPYDLTGGLFGGCPGELGRLLDVDGHLAPDAPIAPEVVEQLKRLRAFARCEVRLGHERWLFSPKAMELMSLGKARPVIDALAEKMDVSALDNADDSNLSASEDLPCVSSFKDDPRFALPELDRAMEMFSDLARIWSCSHVREDLGLSVHSFACGADLPPEPALEWLQAGVAASGLAEMVEAYYAGVPVEDIVGDDGK